MTVSYSVTGAGATPTGMVTVSDGGSITCSATVADGSCSLTFSTAGSKSLTASYTGDANYNPGSSDAFSHQVNPGAVHGIPTLS